MIPQRLRFAIIAINHHHHHFPPWIRSFDVFRYRRLAIITKEKSKIKLINQYSTVVQDKIFS
jgi:hypothetical protein